MSDLLALVQNIRRRPGMYFSRSDITYNEVVAYLLGYDAAADGLFGFREFLVLRNDVGNNMWWPALVERLACGEAEQCVSEEDQAVALTMLFDLVTEFAAEVNAGGLDHILHEYHSWLRRQTWYKADLERMEQFPAPDVLDADEAAAALGITRSALFTQLGGLDLRPLRRGADVVFRRKDVTRAVARARDGAAKA